jgi:hypothetical protein
MYGTAPYKYFIGAFLASILTPIVDVTGTFVKNGIGPFLRLENTASKYVGR